jgi:hypothetical protein
MQQPDERYALAEDEKNGKWNEFCRVPTCASYFEKEGFLGKNIGTLRPVQKLRRSI